MVVLLIRVKKPLIIVAECWITLLNAVRAVLVLDIANCVCCAVLYVIFISWVLCLVLRPCQGVD